MASTIPCWGGGSWVPAGTTRPELRTRSGSSSLSTTRSKIGRSRCFIARHRRVPVPWPPSRSSSSPTTRAPRSRATLPALAAQLRDGDELIVVDNASADGTPSAVRELAPAAIVIETGANLGFAAACNRGAEAASGELLCLLNPDAVPQPGWREAIERPLVDGRGWAAWQALVTADGGREINTRGGVLHFTGIAWAGGAGEPLDELPASEPLALERPGLRLRRLPGDRAATLFDASARCPSSSSSTTRTSTSRCGCGSPAAGSGSSRRRASTTTTSSTRAPTKWRYLERNRWATLIRTYPAALLALLAPALLATELALVVAAAAGGWLPQKLRAWGETIVCAAAAARRAAPDPGRRARSAPASSPPALTASLDSAYLGRAGRSRALAAVLRRLLGARAVRLLGAGRVG